MWYTYIIRSVGGRLYTGITTNPDRRTRQHNGEIKGGARATRIGRPWKLEAIWAYLGRGEAEEQERYIKKMTHVQKIDLITVQLLVSSAERKNNDNQSTKATSGS
jgi:putative endonuclease